MIRLEQRKGGGTKTIFFRYRVCMSTTNRRTQGSKTSPDASSSSSSSSAGDPNINMVTAVGSVGKRGLEGEEASGQSASKRMCDVPAFPVLRAVSGLEHHFEQCEGLLLEVELGVRTESGSFRVVEGFERRTLTCLLDSLAHVSEVYESAIEVSRCGSWERTVAGLTRMYCSRSSLKRDFERSMASLKLDASVPIKFINHSRSLFYLHKRLYRDSDERRILINGIVGKLPTFLRARVVSDIQRFPTARNVDWQLALPFDSDDVADDGTMQHSFVSVLEQILTANEAVEALRTNETAKSFRHVHDRVAFVEKRGSGRTDGSNWLEAWVKRFADVRKMYVGRGSTAILDEEIAKLKSRGISGLEVKFLKGKFGSYALVGAPDKLDEGLLKDLRLTSKPFIWIDADSRRKH